MVVKRLRLIKQKQLGVVLPTWIYHYAQSPFQAHFKPSKLHKEIVATDTVHLMVANGNFAQITAGYVRYSTISSDFAGQRNGNVEVVQRQRSDVACNADIARAKST